MGPEQVATVWVHIYLYFENYSYFSATALYCYDYFLTLDREVKYVWQARRSFANILFYSYRYSAFLNTALELLTRIAWPWQSTWSCGILERIQMALDVIILISATVFAALRVYAIFGRNAWLFGAILVSGLVHPCILIHVFIVSSPGVDNVLGHQACELGILDSTHGYEDWMIGARAASVVSDGLVLVLTCMKTLRRTSPADMIAELGITLTLREILLKDTALCFGLLCIVNVVGIATGHLTQFIEIWTMWTAVLTSILLSHLTLDLREVSADGDGSEMLSRTLRSMAFAITTDEDSVEDYE